MQSINTICICGGGNLGHTFSAILGSNNDLTVKLLTRKPNKWNNTIEGINEEQNKIIGKIDSISHLSSEVIPGADLILVSLPCFAREELLRDISPYISQNTIIGCLPGYGNFELQASNILPIKEKNISIFGSLRIPYICRTEIYGKSVRFFKKSEIQIATKQTEVFDTIKLFFEKYTDINVVKLNNLLELVLCNSNPILHPARLFDLFATPESTHFTKEVPFYETWSVNASQILIQMDNELFQLIEAIPLNLNGVTPILKHYESTNAKSLTEKIKSIQAFKGIMSPMVHNGTYWDANYKSRYFTEDIPYGLSLIKSLAIIFNISTPIIDKVIYWTQSQLNLQLLTNNGELGDDAYNFPIFQKYKLTTPAEIVHHYQVKN
ncbi:NAD/NADP octopine/nopaline dehydrogenase family protein [Carboxylicivirga sp. M1479]|uniref:NAD/NADP octopine/nopaline dehydrogenase family protein n=1 Tax=Carboxylicivirga sp. M1479 TaxID=2594476 RepID=UPI0011783F24|nr:NAD/NADP octopine/nopaline dehydrogenase family protein [Carboxylicivirga sp. M1479]TRX66232.1 NAD/NADP octopine/nopaline dehydrogenase [Carboxylicivirga sp. M1479]